MARRSPGILTILVILLVAAAGYWKSRPEAEAAPAPRAAGAARLPGAGAAGGENHFSPAENLERLDAGALGRAQRSVDIAMYAFTDQFLAERLRELAARGVKVRLYRDRSQYEQEQRTAAAHDDTCPTDALRGVANVEIRVKADRGRNIMHLKAYLVDGALLRDGSANWSPSGLKSQDNNARFTSDPAQVRAFQQQFEAMWQREDNLVVR